MLWDSIKMFISLMQPIPHMNKGRNFNIPNWAYHPAITALPVAVVLIFFLPQAFNKYTIKLNYERIISYRSNWEFHDLNHDGNSERIIGADNSKSGASISIYYADAPYCQWDFEGMFFEGNFKFVVSDSDLDGIDEIYAFTYHNDSVLLNSFDYTRKGEFILHNKALIYLPQITYDTISSPCDRSFELLPPTDLNGDNCNEILFTIATGYNLEPRKVYAYDVKQDSLYSSPNLGGYFSHFQFVDINNDGMVEITFTNYGPGNGSDTTVPLPDNAGYVIVLDHTLQFLFPPIANHGTYCSVHNEFMRRNGKFELLTIWGFNAEIMKPPEVKIYTITGKLTDHIALPQSLKGSNFNIIQFPPGSDNPNIVFLPITSKPFALNSKLKEVSIGLPDDPISMLPNINTYDFDQDGEKELLFETGTAGRFMLTRSKLEHPVYFSINASSNDKLAIYTILHHGQAPQFCFQSDRHQYIFTYAFNPLWYLQFALYPGIYLLVFTFIIIKRRIQRTQLQQKYETEKQIYKLQLQSIRNQMDPHFTFNVLNTIGSVILQKKTDESYDLLMKFSKLIRATVQSSDKLFRTLKEEIDFVRNYLDLQQTRSPGLFSFEISIDANADIYNLMPKMILHTYAENAFKHGLATKKTGGLITINILRGIQGTEIVITDNGIGREAAKRNNTNGTGKGLSLIQQFYAMLNQQNKQPITETFTDLYDENGAPCGTRVTINIPEGYHFGHD